MALIVTTGHLAVIAARTAHEFTKLALGEGNRAVPPDVSGGWNVTALMTPFNPVREKANPPGGASGAVHVADWQDGAEGDSVAYTANEVGLYATPAGGNEYLAFYESEAAGAVFSKAAGSIILRRFRLQATGAQLVNSTFNVSLTSPAATELVAGVVELATQPEVDAEADDERAVTPSKLGAWWDQITILASKIPTLPMSKISNLTSVLAAKANLASPTLTGNPKSTTPSAADDDTSIATTSFVKNQLYRTVRSGTADPVDSTGADGDLYLMRG